MQLDVPFPNWAGRCQQGGLGSQVKGMATPSLALRQRFELLKKLHFGWSCADGFCPRCPHNQHDDPQMGLPKLDKQDISPPSVKIGRPSQYFRHGRNSLSRRCKPRAEEGTTLNQSPAWGMAVERAKALERVSGAESIRASKIQRRPHQ